MESYELQRVRELLASTEKLSEQRRLEIDILRDQVSKIRDALCEVHAFLRHGDENLKLVERVLAET